MSSKNPMPYVKGEHLTCCDICGRVRYASQMRKNWKGLVVCADTCWEPKDPQWEIPFKVRTERNRAVKDARPPKYVQRPIVTDWNKIDE